MNNRYIIYREIDYRNDNTLFNDHLIINDLGSSIGQDQGFNVDICIY